MDTPALSSEKPTRNLQTEALHRHEVFWQITVPLVVGGAIFAALVILAIVAEASHASQWADVALIWLLILPLVLTLLVFLLLAILVYGLWKLLVALPGKMFLLQNFFKQAQAVVKTIGDKLVEPFLKAHSASTGVRVFWRGLFKKVPNPRNPCTKNKNFLG
jgi:hypothetical protein